VGRSGGAHHTTCTTIRHIMGMGRSSAATSHVRPNRLSAGIPAGPLARAATSASDARDADRKAQFRQHPRWRIFVRKRSGPRVPVKSRKSPFVSRFTGPRLCATAREAKSLDQPLPIDETLHRRRTKAAAARGKSGFGRAARALRDAPRRHALVSPLSRARGRARFVTARPPAATHTGPPLGPRRDANLSRLVTTSRFQTKTRISGG
jgi:hypothetical protein